MKDFLQFAQVCTCGIAKDPIDRPAEVPIYHRYILMQESTTMYSEYFGATVEERAENMASSTWSIQDLMPDRRRPFRDLPNSLEMTYDINQQGVAVGSEEEDDSEQEDDSEAEDESEAEENSEAEEESDDEEESDEEEDSDEEENDFELKFDSQRHRFMEKFSAISRARERTKVVYCLSQHYELNYASYPILYFIQLNESLRQIRLRNDTVYAISCSCRHFENGNSPCKHMVLFRILYEDFRNEDSIASRVRLRRRRVAR